MNATATPESRVPQPLSPPWADNVDSVLLALAPRATRTGPAGWSFRLGRSKSRLIQAKLLDDWLIVEADFRSSPATTDPRSTVLRDALRTNAVLPGPAKVVLTPERRLRLRADLMLHEDLDLPARLSAACAGFALAWEAEQELVANSDSENATNPSNVAPLDLKALCTEAGWPVVERASGKLVVDLEVTHGFYQAQLVPAARGARLSCDFEVDAREHSVTSQATSVLLLSASGAVRLGRAALDPGEGLAGARFEVVFDEPPSPLELAQALASLSVVCSHCGEEATMLRDAAVAQRYLGIRGWA